MPHTDRIAIVLPELGTSDVQLSLWYVGMGERVLEGDRIVEVMFPGATFDLSAPATGTIIERRVPANAPIASGEVLGLIEIERL